jgi:hypothetical protein
MKYRPSFRTECGDKCAVVYDFLTVLKFASSSRR